jgi:hypothetical protein
LRVLITRGKRRPAGGAVRDAPLDVFGPDQALIRQKVGGKFSGRTVVAVAGDPPLSFPHAVPDHKDDILGTAGGLGRRVFPDVDIAGNHRIAITQQGDHIQPIILPFLILKDITEFGAPVS